MTTPNLVNMNWIGRSISPLLSSTVLMKAVIAENDDPRIGPHHLAEKQRRQIVITRMVDLSDDVSGTHQRIGEGIADNQSEERGQKTDPDRSRNTRA